MYEESSTRSGMLYLMWQSACNQSTIAIALARGSGDNHWPWAVPAPIFVRDAEGVAAASFELLANGKA